MKRATMKPEEVKYIIIGSTMTKHDESGLVKELLEAEEHHPSQLGMHFYVDKDASVIEPVCITKRGNRLARYEQNSIIIIVEGGMDDDGGYSAVTYTPAQMRTLRAILQSCKDRYPDAVTKLWWELRKGVNPVFTLDDIEEST